ncbi:MAG: biopolymer transporter ExbD [Candidatus Marinimicrobia bacterium]|nr:biopolymer transporter ExbD [Candidatus Neomarinimicrobiota bacterium]MDD5581751.1 biopolymer transporter ExbD [Candidatus Neomarinimicrobiota bacterium]
MLVKKRYRISGEIPSSSMADIAFLLLIFFLLVSTIDPDKGIGFVLPGKGGEFKVNPKNITNVLVNAAGQVLMNDKEIPPHEIHREAARLLAENPLMIFSVQTAENTKYQDYITVIDQLKLANATRISIADSE